MIKHVVSVSGGKDSAATLLIALERFGKDRITPIFCDTGNEHSEVYAYLAYLEQALDIKIVRLRANFDQEIAAKRMFVARDVRTRREYDTAPVFDAAGNPVPKRDKRGNIIMRTVRRNGQTVEEAVQKTRKAGGWAPCPLDKQGQAPCAGGPEADRKPVSRSVHLERKIPKPDGAVLHGRVKAQRSRCLPDRPGGRWLDGSQLAGRQARREHESAQCQAVREHRPVDVCLSANRRMDGCPGIRVLRLTWDSAQSALQARHGPCWLHAMHQRRESRVEADRCPFPGIHRDEIAVGVACLARIETRPLNLFPQDRRVREVHRLGDFCAQYRLEDRGMVSNLSGRPPVRHAGRPDRADGLRVCLWALRMMGDRMTIKAPAKAQGGCHA